MDWQIHNYTQIYADAMRDTGCSEAIYIRKSAMYRATGDAVNIGGCVDLIHKLFRHMPSFVGVEVQGFAKLIGKGCAPVEETLRTELWRLLEPDDFSM